MSRELLRTFDFLSAVMPREPSWRIIGSAALWLSGVPLETVPGDVDVVAPFEVIEAVRKGLGIALSDAKPSERFRSRPFFQYQPDGGVVIDFMGDLEVFNGMWCQLHFKSSVLARGVYIPDLDEQVAILRQFGRAKDLQRIEAVRTFLKT